MKQIEIAVLVSGVDVNGEVCNQTKKHVLDIPAITSKDELRSVLIGLWDILGNFVGDKLVVVGEPATRATRRSITATHCLKRIA